MTCVYTIFLFTYHLPLPTVLLVATYISITGSQNDCTQKEYMRIITPSPTTTALLTVHPRMNLVPN